MAGSVEMKSMGLSGMDSVTSGSVFDKQLMVYRVIICRPPAAELCCRD